jgi:hypothetical protein
MPTAIPIRKSGQTWLVWEGQFWRMLTFVENAQTLQTIGSSQEALQVGRGLGVFHNLVSDIPADALGNLWATEVLASAEISSAVSALIYLRCLI